MKADPYRIADMKNVAGCLLWSLINFCLLLLLTDESIRDRTAMIFRKVPRGQLSLNPAAADAWIL
jgi:hypothetical protein